MSPRLFGIALALFALLTATPEARSAGPLDGDFQINSAFVVLDHGVLQLNAQIQYPNNSQIRSALQDGVTLVFDVDLTISRPRRFWFNATVLDTSYRHELMYHAVTDRYVLVGDSEEQQESFATLDEAFERLGHIEDQPILV